VCFWGFFGVGLLISVFVCLAFVGICVGFFCGFVYWFGGFFFLFLSGAGCGCDVGGYLCWGLLCGGAFVF